MAHGDMVLRDYMVPKLPTALSNAKLADHWPPEKNAAAA